ncbi:MAG: glutamyl-tRNA reductase [Legionellaceae bacterium]|nr:glutamyl-tRNA reductase [Legionellaceae bacterium]
MIFGSNYMVFVACGLNYKTAPLDIREKFAMSADDSSQLLHDFTNSLDIDEAAILFTCNRTEIYCHTDNPNKIIPWVSDTQKIATESIRPYFYTHQENEGIKHLMRVGSGLDSMMLGEPQILGQIKQAYSLANEAGTIGGLLDPIFQYTFQACKKIRNSSGVGKNPISIAYAASQLVGQIFNDYKKLNVFLIGSGETSTLVSKYLQEAGVKNFMITNRTNESAELLANKVSGKIVPILDMAEHLSKADVIISATSCPLPFISKAMVEKALRERNNSPMFFLDLALPRDIEPNITELDEVHLYNIDDLQSVTEQGLDERRKAALNAERLINQEVENYISWFKSREANQVISDYEDYMQKLSILELQRATSKLTQGQCPHEVLNEFNRRLTNKLTHMPKVGLRQIAVDNQEWLQDFVTRFYKQD